MATSLLPPDFKEFLRLLNSRQVEYLRIGGYAVGYYGYRVYAARAGKVVVLLLCAGDKKSQAKDIENAKAHLREYQARSR